MLSRVAERIYWLGRYLERVENTARLTYVHSSFLMDLPDLLEVNWFNLITIFDAEHAYFERHARVDEYDVMLFLLADKTYGSSMVNSLAAARENVRTSLDILPEELWEQVNELHLMVKGELSSVGNRRRRQKLLLAIAEKCQCIWGIVANHMSRNYAYDFMQIGKHLERADMSSRILELTSILVSETRSDLLRQYEQGVWATLLRAISAQQMYIQTHNTVIKADDVLTFLIKDKLFPRSLLFSLNAVGNYLNYLPHRQKVVSMQRDIMTVLEGYDADTQAAGNVRQMMDDLQNSLNLLNGEISNTWFYPDYSAS